MTRSGGTSVGADEVLQQELWALVEQLAARGESPSRADAEAFLAGVRQQARRLLRHRQHLSATTHRLASESANNAGDDSGDDADAEQQQKMSAAANERVARAVLDGPPLTQQGSDVAPRVGECDEDEDKSDTLSDCTTLTESSSVYGIHNTWVDLATLYSLPFVFQTEGSGASRRLKPVPPLNIGHEQTHLNKVFHECQRALHTMRAVATVDALRKVLDRGVTVLHFSGHGGQIAGRTSCLVFEDTHSTGLAHLVDAATLRSILGGGALQADESFGGALRTSGTTAGDAFEDDAPPRAVAPGGLQRTYSSASTSAPSSRGVSGTLKLVFVSSCHSKAIGDVFIQAGVAHVVCVRCDDKVLDESASMFSHSFYHAALAGKSVHQAFEIARVRVSAEMRVPDNEGDKFVLLESSSLHAESCPLSGSGDRELPEAVEVDFSAKSCKCHAASAHFVFADISVGKWVDVSASNKFAKTLPAVSESFVGREHELYTLAGLVNAHRFVTVRGPPGIGKSTLSIKLAHFLADRNAFPDGVAFIRLRGVQSLEGLESAIKSALFPEGGREKELPLHQVLSELRVLLVMDNMEDPINAHPSVVREFLLHLLQNTPQLSFLMTARQAMGGGMAGFDEKVLSLNRLSHYHAADLFLKQSPRPLLLSELGDSIDASGASRTSSVLEALTNHPLMAFLDGHPQAISLCAPLLQDRSLAELTRAVLSRGVSELQVVGLPAHDRSAVNTLVTSLSVSLEQVKMHHGQDVIRFFALLGLLPAGAMPADFKSLWGDKWEVLVETLLRFSLIQRNRIPGFALASRGLPKRSDVTGSSHQRHRSRGSRASDGYDQPLLLALKSYGDYLTGSGSSSSGRSTTTDATDSETGGGASTARALHSVDRHMLNSFTRSGRAARVAEHVERLDSQAEIMSVCVSYSTFPFITSYARSLLGMYDGDGAKNEALASVCGADRDLFLYNCARHFWKVAYWVFQHICTLAARSSASYLILDMHESNLWMMLDVHIRMVDEWGRESRAASDNQRSSAESDGVAALSVDCASASTASLREKIGGYVIDVACFFAHALFLSGRHRGAWNAANKALHIAKHDKDSRAEANVRKLMGILLTTETKFDEAKAQFGMALILYKAVGDKIGQAASLSAIGMIHTRKGNLRGAHNCFTKALTLYEWFKHALGQLNCHQRLANLEKKLRDGDGLARKNAPNSGYSHHYAATRRLQGDLNRKRNGEYIVRWVGHEMSLLLELPLASPDKLHEAHAPSSASLGSAVANAPAAVDASRSPSSGVSNTPKKCRLGMIIDQKEKATTAAAAASSSSSGSGGAVPAAPSAAAANAESGVVDKLKNSSFARRREYDSAIRKSANSSGGVAGGGSSAAPSLSPDAS
ncbi:hypothetical protein PybrP1_013127 [[Pythium] brassicae (nom. inval.)]|nr:hypothetical protein PybrP1_013127 [[Pythium] brassicae (nom. inval.)]